jgi:hypothetical protein
MTNITRDLKINILNKTLNEEFPKLEGDKVTFIGSTFLKYGAEKPYLNHCIALDTCSNIPDAINTVIESYKTEKEVLLAWQKVIQMRIQTLLLVITYLGLIIHLCMKEQKN